MSNRSTPFSLIGILALSIGVAPAQSEPLRQALEVMVTSEVREKEPILLFTIANVSNASITLPESQVPWKHHYSVTIVVVPRNQDPLPVISPIADDFGLATITLQPGEKLSGELRPSRYANNLGETLQERDAIVFWYYAPVTDSEKALGEFGGWARITLR